MAEWAPETGRNPCAGHCRFELYRGSPRKDLSKEDQPSSFSLARPGLMGDSLGQPVRAFLAALMLLAGLILVAACANLGSLFAARAADRSREIALRLALGSSRERILRQLLTEAILISSIGGATGLLGGLVLLRWLCAWQPIPSFPINLPVNPDANVYAVALLLALASGLLCGIVPIRLVLRANPYQIVKSGSASTVGRRFTVRDGLLVVQITVCAVLVTSSLVAVRGWYVRFIATSVSCLRTPCSLTPIWTWRVTAATRCR